MIETNPWQESLRTIQAEPRFVQRDGYIVHMEPPANII